MDFRFTRDQEDLINAAKAVFDGENTVERMRMIAEGKEVEGLWPQLAELGLIGLMAPESAGGLEQPLVVMAGVAEAAGYAGVPEPVVEVAGITIPIAATDELGDLISGENLFGVNSALRPYQDQRLTKTKGETVNSIDPLRVLVAPELPNKESALAATNGAVLTAAQLVGLSQRMVDMSVEYARERQQFGKPIGSFQAIKHHLANVYTQIEFTRPMVHLAALQSGRTVHTAKVAAIDTSMLAAETAIQIHGGMGYTCEVDLHMFMKRAWALCGEWGDRNYHMKRLEEIILDGEAILGPGTTFR